MNKDFSEKKLLSFPVEKQIRSLYELCVFIEKNSHPMESNHFQKLKKYHQFLENSEHERIQKLNKEFKKIKSLDYQFQIYLMNLERALGQSKKDYDFIVKMGDSGKEKIKTFPLICLMDSIRSAHNIGSMFRNAECFGCEKIILTGLSPTPENPQVQKTAMGCDQNIKWEYNQNALQEVQKLKNEGWTIWSVETSKKAKILNELTDTSVPEKLVLIFGHEQFGISHELLEASNDILAIELYGAKNSLNVGVSQAICLNTVTRFLKPN